MRTKLSILITVAVMSVLVLAACGGAAPETESSESGEVVTMYVGPELVECTGEGPQTCMMIKDSPDGEYQYFYDQIDGFTYEEGYEYELKVQVSPVDNPPAGGSSLQYTLVEEVSKTPVFVEGESDLVTMYIAPELVDCTGVAPQTCMLVKYNPGEEYTYFYGQIEGFTFEPGFNYELKVAVSDVENPPADGSSLQYTLVEEVSKTPADATVSTMPATDAQGGAELTGTIWALSTYAGADGTMATVLPTTEVTAVFGEDGTLSGNSGCNNYNTSYTVDGNNISVNEMIAATMMMCPEPIMQQETAFLADLTAAATYEIAGDTLTLFDANGNPVAVFTAQQPAPLTGIEWVVTGYNNGKQAVVSVINGTTITAVFSEDGMVSGNASCNTYNAPYEVDGSNITIGVGMTTMMACPGDGVMEQETAYLAAITTAATYSIQGDTLELRTADGALAVSYVAKEPSDLAAISWLVISYNNGREAAVSPILGTELTLEFEDDGNITGSAGCNRYFGPYTSSGETIQIGPLATTRALCPEPAGVMEQEQEFLAALQSAATYTIQNDKLDMRTAEGSIAVIAIPNTPLPAEVQALVENATFNNLAGGGMAPVTLSNGIYQEAIPDSAASMNTSLLDKAAFGQIDGQPAAAVTLATNNGGSGTYIDLAVVTFADGAATNVATIMLGDRVQVNSVEISESGIIVVDMVEAGEGDPLCCPTQHVINLYALQDGELVEVSSTAG